MAQVINTNVFSLNSQRQLNRSQSSMQVSLERLSSGLRINRAKDDAAGFAISERFTAQIRGMQQASRNANDGISLVQTAEGAMAEISNSLQRMRELAVQASNETVNSTDRASLNDEFSALATEITRITDVTEFNNISLLGAADTVSFQVGFEGGANNTISVALVDVNAASGVASMVGGNINTASAANAFISAADIAINKVSELRADFGAVQNRLEATVRNLGSMIENQSAARSRVLDADFASETANLTRNQILQQAGTAMLSQANSLPQNVLSLLG